MTSSQEFKKTAKNFQMWVNAFIATVDDTIPQAQKALDERSKSISQYSPESDAEIILRDISKKLDSVNSAFNGMLKSINML